MQKNIFLYVVLALLLTFGILYYQRTTGPTYEKNVVQTLNGKDYTFDFMRSHDNTTPCYLKLIIPDNRVSAVIKYRRFPTNDEFTDKPFDRVGDTLMVELPNQPMAGKLQYSVTALTPQGSVDIGNDIVVRFKGHVPSMVLAFHIFFMLASYFFAIFAGLLAVFRHPKYKFYMMVVIAMLGVGGLMLGPLVQKYAFGVWWSGFPFGMDLTDNKLLIAFVAWMIAWVLNRKQDRRWWVVVAMVVHMIVYCIPHSAMGSEYDYEKESIGTSEKFKD